MGVKVFSHPILAFFNEDFPLEVATHTRPL